MPLGIIIKKTLQKWQNWILVVWHNFRNRHSSSEGLIKKQILHLKTVRAWPSWKQWRHLPNILSIKEKKILQFSLSLSCLCFLFLGGWLFVSHCSEIPAVGGTYTEGLVGSPQFVNPLYALASDVDADLSSLIYSGLFRWDSQNGLILDLAESYLVSEDQKTYTIKLKDGIYWHNNDPVTANDVVFTIQSIQNPAYRSPLYVSFRGVEVSQIDEKTIQFVLVEPFASFLSTLTVGILPANLWQDIDPRNAVLASLNLSPVGSGPYCFDKFTVDKKGEIRSYSLKRNTGYYGEKAKIENLTFKFYPDQNAAINALQNQNIEGLSFVPHNLISEIEKNRSLVILRPTVPQEVILFFNQENQPLLKNDDLRQALALSLNKQTIVDSVLSGHGTIIDSPILPDAFGFNQEITKINQNITEAVAFLNKTDYLETSPNGFRAKKIETTENSETKEGWNELTLTLTTVNQPDFITTAEIIAEQAKTIGIKVQIETVEASELYEKIIKPRTYQMLLTAVQFGLNTDPYPFWHSSQIKDPGLNLALYVNRKTDELLEKARTSLNNDEQKNAYLEFQNLLVQDLPAIFLYQPNYTYVISNKIKNISLTKIITPADRFQNITSWYTKTKKVIK